jgi:hypothetical protein
LALKNDNGKVMFRLGQAQHILGEFADALATLERALVVRLMISSASSLFHLEIVPEDAAISREIQLVKRSQQAFKDKEKKLFGKLFA